MEDKNSISDELPDCSAAEVFSDWDRRTEEADQMLQDGIIDDETYLAIIGEIESDWFEEVCYGNAHIRG